MNNERLLPHLHLLWSQGFLPFWLAFALYKPGLALGILLFAFVLISFSQNAKEASEYPSLLKSLLTGMVLQMLVKPEDLKLQEKTMQLLQQKTQDLHERQTLLLTIAEAAPIGIFHTNAKGHLIYANSRWLNIANLKDFKAGLQGFFETIHPDDKNKVMSLWSESLQKQQSFSTEFRILRKDGGLRWVNSIARANFFNGEFHGFVGINLDISERKTKDTLLEVERSRSIQSSKMAALGEMAGGIAHEINNPLAIIAGKISILKSSLQKGAPAEKLIEHAEKIESTTYRIARLIKGLRAFSRESSADPMNLFSVNSIVEDTLEFCSERFRHHNVELTVNMNTQIEVLCRPSQLSQALLNLLNNAYDAVYDQTEKWVKIDIEDTGVFVEISVTDSGPGIPANIINRVMEPFFTTKEIGKGTGLGLSISQGLVEAHGGKLSFDRRSPNTRFVITLPIPESIELKKAS